MEGVKVKSVLHFFRAVKVSSLIYEIIVAEINAIKYFNAVNATLFTSGVRFPLTRKLLNQLNLFFTENI